MNWRADYARRQVVNSLPSGSIPLRQIYNALWYPALPVALLASGGRDPAIRRERLGRNGPLLPNSPARRVWVHVASVGEVEAVRPVLRRLDQQSRTVEFVVTSMTQAGREAAQRRLPGLSAYHLAPLDFAGAVRTFLTRLQPALILIAETELWPNFFVEGARAGARVALMNGRMSARSFDRYRLIRGLIREALAVADKILVQTALDAARFRALGASRERIFVTGNTKFDLADTPPALRPSLAAFAPDRPLLVAGSTAVGEERIVLSAYRRLLENYPSLALVLAPRHLERMAEVENILRELAFDYVNASQLDAGQNTGSNAPGIILLDTMGELRALYPRATIAFVGGSILPPRGGQSLAEPACVAVPVLFGPYYDNQQEIGDALIREGAGEVVSDEETLAASCARWLSDSDSRNRAGARARIVMERVAHGAASTVQHLEELLDRG